MGIRLGIGKGNRINVVIKDHVIRFLEKKTGHPTEVKFYGEYYLPEGVIIQGKIMEKDRLKEILVNCVKEWKIKNRDIQFLVPDSVVVVRNLQIPKEIKDEEIKGYIYMELGGTIHLPIEHPVFNIEVLGETDEVKEVTLFAAPEALFQEYVDLLEEVKLNPLVADLSPLAMYRLFYEFDRVLNEDHTLCVQFDIQSVTLTIFRKHKLIFMHDVRMDIPARSWEIHEQDSGEKKLTWSGEEEDLYNEMQDIVVEIERVMNFYRFNATQGEDQISRLLLSGDHPWLQNVKRRIEEVLDIPIICFNDEELKVHQKRAIPVRYHLPLGLALKEVK